MVSKRNHLIKTFSDNDVDMLLNTSNIIKGKYYDWKKRSILFVIIQKTEK